MNRRGFLSWVGAGALVAAVPAPVRALAKAYTPAPVLRRLRTIVVDPRGAGDARTIQGGLNLLGKEGGEVLLREGVYRMKKVPSIPPGVTVIGGKGPGSIIIFADTPPPPGRWIYFQ